LAAYTRQGPRNEEGYRDAHRKAMELVEAIHRFTAKYPDRCGPAISPGEVEQLAAAGKRAIVIGMENAYPLGTDLANVEKFYRLGVRYITLSHNGHNQVCDSCTPRTELRDGPREHGGLSPLGRRVVGEMNRLGIMVDVSHVAAASLRDVLTTSRAPVLASHSGCKGVYDHRRNLDDGQLRELAARGGVIQVVAVPEFLTPRADQRQKALEELAERVRMPAGDNGPELEKATPEQRRQWLAGVEEVTRRYAAATVEDYLDHVDHAVRIAGIEHVGIGSDFDGGGGVEGFQNHAECPNVTAGLLRRGYSEGDLVKIWGGNLLRVWREVERCREG
ncbi:MAG: dipeptidase, partial [Thermoguttaceae bacterium]